MPDAEDKMKRTTWLFSIFLIFSIVIITCPIISLWDKWIILNIQNILKNIPLWIPLLPDCKLYSIMIAVPLVVVSSLFFKRKMYKGIVLFCSIPLVTFFLNCILKPLVHRARPPYEMQIAVHPHSFSYVSSHSLVTICLWGTVIYLINKHCKNRTLKLIGIIFSAIWILFVGLSRVWLGVHNPTDVIGAYLLGLFILSLYLPFFERGETNA